MSTYCTINTAKYFSHAVSFEASIALSGLESLRHRMPVSLKRVEAKATLHV